MSKKKTKASKKPIKKIVNKKKHPAKVAKKKSKAKIKIVAKTKKIVQKAVVTPTAPVQIITSEQEVKNAKRDKVKILEGDGAKKEVSQFELNELVDKLIYKAKHRKRNKNALQFKEARAMFDSYN
jgi:hypothetical protein